MKYRLISAVTKDGYIAKFSGHLPKEWTSNEEQDFFVKDMKNCEFSIMGRVTHELSYKENKKRIIFSRSRKKINHNNKNHIYFNSDEDSFNNIINLIKPISKICILGGTLINDYFFDRNLIDEMHLTIEPIVFNRGLPLFSKINFIDFDDKLKNMGYYVKILETINTIGTKYICYAKK